MNNGIVHYISCLGKWFHRRERQMNKRIEVMQIQYCRYCNIKLPPGRSTICQNYQCVQKFAEDTIEKNRTVFERLGEI